MTRLMSVLLGVCLLAGCATKKQVASMEGRGTVAMYNAPFDQVWRAAVDGMQVNDLEILTADRERGFISARRNVQVHTFGENVGLWVRRLNATQTEVEVVSRQAGPPVAWLKNWENEIHRAISANLTREMPGAVGAAPFRDNVERGIEIVPEKRFEPQASAAVLEQRRRVDAIRAERQARMDELKGEDNSTRRAVIQRQIDRLNEDLRIEELHLRDLE